MTAPSGAVEDPVVGTYDVFVTRAADPGGALYLLQSPLRPVERPYDLEACDEVRVKARGRRGPGSRLCPSAAQPSRLMLTPLASAQPKQCRIELDLPLDTRAETYDRDAPEALRIRSLSLQSKPVALKQGEQGSLAVATFAHGCLLLAPLSSVVQLRPSLAHLDAADDRRREAERANGKRAQVEEEEGEEEGAGGTARLTPLQVQVRRRETERQLEARLQSHAYLRQLEEEEPWLPLRPHGQGSAEALAVLARLKGCPGGRAGDPVSPADYMNALLPPRPPPTSLAGEAGVSAAAGLGLSRAFLEALPLEGRLGALFSRGNAQLLPFATLQRLAPGGTPCGVLLGCVQQHAVLVQGLWASKSSLVAGGDPEAERLRDALLLLFVEQHTVPAERLAGLAAEAGALRGALQALAQPCHRQPGAFTLRHPPDAAFLQEHPEVAAQQAQQWAQVRARLGLPGGAALSQAQAQAQRAPSAQQPLPGRGPQPQAPPPTPAALGALLAHVLPPDASLLNGDAVRALLAVAPAAAGARAAASSDDVALAAALGAGWVALAGRLVRRTTGDGDTDPLRSVVLDLLRERTAAGAQPSVKKADVQRSAAVRLGGEVAVGLYGRVMAALCVSDKGAWTLRTGMDQPQHKKAKPSAAPQQDDSDAEDMSEDEDE